jgi:hypothetical protein
MSWEHEARPLLKQEPKQKKKDKIKRDEGCPWLVTTVRTGVLKAKEPAKLKLLFIISGFIALDMRLKDEGFIIRFIFLSVIIVSVKVGIICTLNGLEDFTPLDQTVNTSASQYYYMSYLSTSCIRRLDCMHSDMVERERERERDWGWGVRLMIKVID